MRDIDDRDDDDQDAVPPGMSIEQWTEVRAEHRRQAAELVAARIQQFMQQLASGRLQAGAARYGDDDQPQGRVLAAAQYGRPPSDIKTPEEFVQWQRIEHRRLAAALVDQLLGSLEVQQGAVKH